MQKWTVFWTLFQYLVGQASSANAAASGKLAEFFANIAWDFATKEGFRIFKSQSGSTSGNPTKRSYTTWSMVSSHRYSEKRTFSTSSRASHQSAQIGHLVISPDGLSYKAKDLYSKLKEFIEVHIYSAEQELRNYQFTEKRWTPHPLTEELKVIKNGLTWNLEILWHAW